MYKMVSRIEYMDYIKKQMKANKVHRGSSYDDYGNLVKTMVLVDNQVVAYREKKDGDSQFRSYIKRIGKSMNKNYKINIDSISKAQKFNEVALGYECDIDILKGRYVIDAKSILGIFSLDLEKEIDIYIHSDDEEILKKFEEDMEEFR